MQKILKYVYLKSQTPHRHAKPEGFVYFQIIGKPINGTKEIDTLMLYVQIWDICVCVCVCFFPFISLLSHLAKILNSSAVIFTVDLMQAQNFHLLQKVLPELGERVHAPFYIMNLIF